MSLTRHRQDVALRILVITYYYPPDRAVGGYRARKVVEALRGAGHEVSVIAAGSAGSHDDGVDRVAPLPSIRDVYAHIRGWLRVPAKDRVVSPHAGSEIPTRVPTWKRWIYSFIWLPDDKQNFVSVAVRRARAYDPRPDLIYTTAPPFSVHLAGLILKGLTGARWIAEFRDPWTGNPWKPAFLRSAASRWLEARLERLCLETADLVVGVTEGIAERLGEASPETDVAVVRNGIEVLRSVEAVGAEPETSGTNGPFEIVHAGSFYHSRDPFPFLSAVERLVEEESLGPDDIRVRLIGATEAYEGRSIGEFIRERGLDGHVVVDGWMPPDACLRHIHDADGLLLFALDQPDQVPNKLYEYLGARRPILAIADAEGETARMLEEAGGHHVVRSNDADAIRSVLGGLLAARGRRGPVGDDDVLERWTTSAQMGGLVGVVEGLG